MRFVVMFLMIFALNILSFGQNGVIVERHNLEIKKTDLWALISSNDSLKAEYAYANNLNFAEIVYVSDSLNINGFLITPKDSGHYPVIIFNRGGNRDFNPLTLKMLFFSTAALANEGYIILAGNYRNQDEFGGKDVNDVLNLMHVADKLEYADTSKIGMFGWSRGGMMTYLSLKASDRIKTAVIGNGPTDLFSSINKRPELENEVLSECIPNYWINKEVELKKRSAVYWADSLNKTSSLLLLCGSLDAQVDYHQSIDMATKLAAIDYDYTLKVYATNHGFYGKSAELNEELITWFNNHLKDSQHVVKKKIAITIDDVPNTRKFQSDQYQSFLLKTLDSLAIPIAIFINEGFVYKTIDTAQNLKLLEEWVTKKYITVGNHTYSHLRYSESDYETFLNDIVKGELISRQLANTSNKKLQYFRFPYNDLGLDSVQHVRIDSALANMGYIIAPFTVESSDWMFNKVYEYYLTNGEIDAAAEIGALYVEKTLAYVHFFDSIAQTIYGRHINQIYLCHDNTINTNYLKEIITRLESENYEFVSMDEAMKDAVYYQNDTYYKKWGISWVYRWMSDANERRELRMKEPDISEIEVIYDGLIK
jgi:peptidoglycan-N-acetylglucosamine deacetylase